MDLQTLNIPLNLPFGQINLLDVLIPAAVLGYISSIYARSQKSRRANPSGLPLPPGPRGLPLIGNVLDVPKTHNWLKGIEWKKQYGDIVYLENFGAPLVFLSSYADACELLERRSAIYSDRPIISMIELQQWDWLMPFARYGERWRKSSSCLKRYMEHSHLTKYQGKQIEDAHVLLKNMIQSPEDFFNHVRSFVGSTTVSFAYGFEVQRENDPLITLVEDGAEAAIASSNPASPVNIFPWLKHTQAWFLGFDFLKVNKGRTVSHAIRFNPYNDVKRKMREGTASPSMASDLIEAYTDESGVVKDEELIADTTGAIYIGGSETTASVLLTFIFAMLHTPEVQVRAQAEIDRVTGGTRLPTFEDRDSLPYVRALIDECLRWHSVGPTGIPHRLTQDDVYKGYFLPKGTVILPNQWLMLRDPEIYPRPEKFNPERFLTEDANGQPQTVQMDPKKIAFGFGRRLCPGRNLAMNMIYIAVSSILATVTIAKTDGEENRPIDIRRDFTSGIASHPNPFKCLITPRSAAHSLLVRSSVDSHN